MRESHPAKTFLKMLTPRLPEMLSTLRKFVVVESPSLEKARRRPLLRCTRRGMAQTRRRASNASRKNIAAISFASPGGRESRGPGGQFLVLGHYDTVYSSGTLAKMPFRVAAGKAYGPGTFDMKAGIVQALFALDALQQPQ